jgi:transposase
MFGKLKDWRHIHTRYDRCAHTFFSAICFAATILAPKLKKAQRPWEQPCWVS